MSFRIGGHRFGGPPQQARLTYDEIVKLAAQGRVFPGRVVRVENDYLLIGINAERLGRLKSLQLPGRLKPSDFQVGQTISVKVVRAYLERGTNQPCYNLALVEEAPQPAVPVSPLEQKRQQYEGQIVLGIYYDKVQIMGRRRPRIAFGEPQMGFLDQDVPEGTLVKARVERVFEYHGDLTYELALVGMVTDYQSVSDIEPFYIWKKEGLAHPGICPKSLIDAWKAAYGNLTITRPPEDILVVHEGNSFKYTPYLLLLPEKLIDPLDLLWEKLKEKNEVELLLLRSGQSSGWLQEIYLALPELPTIPIGYITTNVKSLADKIGQNLLVRLNHTTLTLRGKNAFFLEAAMSQALFAVVNEEALRAEELTAINQPLVRLLEQAQRQTVRLPLLGKFRVLRQHIPDYYDRSLIFAHGPFDEWHVGTPDGQKRLGNVITPADLPEEARAEHPCFLCHPDKSNLSALLLAAERGTLWFVSSYLLE